jgi:hypothetical protein
VTEATGKLGVERGNENRPLRHSTVQVTPVCRMRDNKFTQRLNTDSTVREEGVSASQENITGFQFQRCIGLTELGRKDPPRFRQQMIEWRTNPHHGSILGLNFMCLG